MAKAKGVPMHRAGVLDVGCHSATLTVVRGRRPRHPADPPRRTAWKTIATHKARLRLHDMLTPDGRLDDHGVRSVQRAVASARAAHPAEWPEVFPFATSVIRDAPNREEVIGRVAEVTGTRLRVLPGLEEARLAYVAARRWIGDTGGGLLVLDIGGGTVEIACGHGERPDVLLSLPLGARAVTRRWLPGGIAPGLPYLREVARHLRRVLARAPGLPAAAPGGQVLACSKTFGQLAVLAAAAGPPGAAKDGLDLAGVRGSLAVLAATDVPRRGDLPGISRHRAEQSLAGALVAESLMRACGVPRVEICPWSTREGLLLETLDARARPAP
ncbi:Ppx/GppA family phosphatase [Spongiactinospora sp. TRM90649]|uniref:Ppx/GppA phosphatase family protein n=1 Tax=Spongiactinospora sp. TRM90649 TaxID=3031114 RepID=UPI0023F6E9CD|nr:Ppx/GppA family phosphatase [Spongiactinospora sp. TRM90649]MDF5757469.1 Ppx/GppA family phosphatase [Spongiactinospora sp. TRM90649]